MDIEEVEQTLNLKFPEDREYESLGGFLMEVAGDVPAVGWEFTDQNYVFTVTEADLNRVIKVSIEPFKEHKKSSPAKKKEKAGVKSASK